MRRSEAGVGKSSLHVQGTQTNYFTYIDANGVQVVVDKLADVPAECRAEVKHIDLSQPARNVPVPRIESLTMAETPVAAKATSGRLCLGEAVGCVHATSFLVGAVVALVLGGAGMLVFRKSTRLVAILAGMLIVAALTTAVLTYARRQAGLPGDGLVTPSVLVDDARAAAKAMDDHHREQARSLDDIDKHR